MFFLFIMDEIINKVKSNNKYFWFIPKGKRLALISQGSSKSKAKINFQNKLSEKIEKYYNTEIIIAKIETPKKINELIGGPIGISFSFKMINDKGKIKNKEDIRTNVVWFTEKYLLKNGFKSEYMLNLLTAIYFNKISIPVLGVIIYDYLNL